MIISNILVRLSILIERWFEGFDVLLEIDNSLNLKTGTTYNLLYTLNLASVDGRPEPGVTSEHVLNFLCFAIVLKHHLSSASRVKRG